MSEITLVGQLICNNDDELAVVIKHLPGHIHLTLKEPGCLSFSVEQTSSPWIWAVSERFQDAASFAVHQARVKASAWGQATSGIKRQYSVTGL